MLFTGIAKEFSLLQKDQYNTIGAFWEEMALQYGLESLQGLGYQWTDDTIFYAIGLKIGHMKEENLEIELPDENWTTVHGKTENLKEIYDEIYRSGALKYEIETFYENGECQIKYFR